MKAGFRGVAMDINMDDRGAFDFLTPSGFVPRAEVHRSFGEGQGYYISWGCLLAWPRLCLHAIRRSTAKALHFMALACNSFCVPFLTLRKKIKTLFYFTSCPVYAVGNKFIQVCW